MEHKKYTHVCVLKYALYVYPAKSRARTRVYLTQARHLGPAGFSAVKLIGSLLFVGTLPEAHHAAHGRQAWSTFRERPGRRSHPAHAPRCPIVPGLRRRESGVARSQSSRSDSTHRLFCDHRHASRLILFTELYTHSKITTAMERDWRSFFIHSRRGGAGSCRLQALNPRTAGWLRCPPAEPQRRGLSDYSPIHTPIFSSPPLLAHAYCRTPNALLGTPNPLLLWRHTQNFMQ